MFSRRMLIAIVGVTCVLGGLVYLYLIHSSILGTSSSSNSNEMGTSTQKAPFVGSLVQPSIPTNAAYLGAWINPLKLPDSGEGGSKELPQLAAFNSAVGRPAAILHAYTGFSAPVPLDTLNAIEQNGSIPLLDWGCTDLSTINSGQQDSVISAYANSLKTFGKPLFLRWYWEMNRSSATCIKSTTGPVYIAAWQHIWTIFHQVGATNVAFVWNPSYDNGSDATPFYPGDQYVDWIGADSYQHSVHGVPTSFATKFSGFYAQWSPHNKPLLIGETGATPANQVSYLQEIGTDLPSKFPNIKAVIYFDSSGNNGAWSLSTAGLAAYGALGSTSYFSYRGN